MSSTERLRSMLDERGVEWWPSEVPWDEDSVTYWIVGQTKWVAIENGEGALVLSSSIVTDLTPAQAIAATLGAGTCHNASKVMDEHGQARFVCSECRAWIDSRMLWNPEYRDGESPWVRDCKLNFCPNCGRRIVEVDDDQ